MRFAKDGKNKLRLLPLLLIGLLFAGCDTSPAPPGRAGFDTYCGYRDNWRFPLCFPFHMVMIDDFARGHLEKYDPTKQIEDISASETLATQVTRIAMQPDRVIFQRTPGDNDPSSYGVLDYRDGTVRRFADEAELLEYLRGAGIAAPDWTGLEQAYNKVWKSLSPPEKPRPSIRARLKRYVRTKIARLRAFFAKLKRAVIGDLFIWEGGGRAMCG